MSVDPVIPRYLKDREQWVGWRTECEDCWTILDADAKECPECGGRSTKRPIDAQSGDLAKASDKDDMDVARATWTSYEEAVAFHEDDDTVTHGVGFVFDPGGEIAGVDLDDCFDEDGNLEDWAQDIVTALSSFTEISPSGNGLHIYVRGELPEGGSRHAGVEMYEDRRYFTVTGDHLEGTPEAVEYREAELGLVHEEYIESKGGTSHAESVDFEIEGEFSERANYSNDLGQSLEEIQDQDGKLDELLSTLDAGYQSTSEADMAAVSKLWFWRFSRDQIADIVRQYRTRPKVIERDDYLELTIGKAATGEQFDPRPTPQDEDVDILGDRQQYRSIDEAELPTGNFVLDKPPREGGSHASLQHLLRNNAQLVVLVSRHTIAEHHLEIIGDMVKDTRCVVHLHGRRKSCENSDQETCPKAPSSLEEIIDLENEVKDICYRKQSVTYHDCPDRFCPYSFIQQAEKEAHAVVTVPQLLSDLDRDFENCNLLIDEEQALGYFRPTSTDLIEVAQKYEPDGKRVIQLLSSNIGTQYKPLEQIREAVDAEQQRRKEEAEEEGRDWRRNSWEIDIVNAVDFIEEVKEELGVTEIAERIANRGDRVTAKAVMDEITERLGEIERPEPRTSPDKFRAKLSKYTARYFHDDEVDPGSFIEAVLFPYDDRPFDFKSTGVGHTLRMVAGREVFHADDLREFHQIAIIAGPEGELLFDDIGVDATTVLIDDFRYAEDFIVVPIGRENNEGELEPPGKQRRRTRRVSKILNERNHPHMAISGTKQRAEEHHANLDTGMSNVVANPESPAKDLRTLWSAGETVIIYENSAVSRGIDAPFFDISAVISTGFATPYWEARRKHYRDIDEEEHNWADAIEKQLKARELTNAVLRPSPTRNIDEMCGTKFIIVSDWDAYSLKYLQDRKLPTFGDAKTAANFVEQLTIPGGLRHTIDETYEEVGGSEREFIEVSMMEEFQETVYDRPSYDLDELTTWRENWWMTSGDTLETMESVVPRGAGPQSTSDIRNVLGGSWSGGRISAALQTMERKGLVRKFTESDGTPGRPTTYWEWGN